MNKEDIIAEIKRTAEENGGKPLGRGRFEKEAGITSYEWMKFWSSFGKAQKEAGYEPNVLQTAYDVDFILSKWADLVQELGSFPTTGDLSVKSHSDSTFPTKNSMLKLGNKRAIAEKLLQYAKTNNLRQVVGICENVIETIPDNDNGNDGSETLKVGAVYLFQHGSRNEYKIGKSVDTVRRGQEIRTLLPNDLTLVHEIKTDDPYGIEAYWHNRFSEKRLNGEWFKLNSSDIKAFRRWRRIY